MTASEVDFGWHPEPAGPRAGTKARLTWRQNNRSGMGELFLFHAADGSEELLTHCRERAAREFFTMLDGVPRDVGEIRAAAGAAFPF